MVESNSVEETMQPDPTSADIRETPEDYPAHEASDVVLRSGSTLRLRPVRRSDAAALLDFERRLPADSVYFRFFGIDRPDATTAASACAVDYRDRFGYVGEGAGRIVAVAHYRRDASDPARAEVTFAVEEVLRGQGVGTRLLERLAEIARARGIGTFEARAPGANPRMLDVFANCGFPMQMRADPDGDRILVFLTPTPDFEAKSADRSEKAAAASMARLFEPRSLAIIGASRERGKIGAEILHNVLAAGFRGSVFPINRSASEIEGVRCHARLADVPGPVDLAIISVPAAAVPAAIDDCAAKGVKGVVVITAGFSETGEEGRRREAALLEKVRDAGMRMVGPNCMGLVNTNPAVSLNATFAPTYPPEGRVALSSQSGALGLALLDYAARLNLGISTFVSVGNKADVSSNDLVQYWAEDPRTDVILLYLESFGSPGVFSRIARRVARRKPIVAVKAGRSRAGARAASSHPGALAESDAVVDASFGRPASSGRARSRSSSTSRPCSPTSPCPGAGGLRLSPTPAGRESLPPTPARLRGSSCPRSPRRRQPRCAAFCRPRPASRIPWTCSRPRRQTTTSARCGSCSPTRTWTACSPSSSLRSRPAPTRSPAPSSKAPAKPGVSPSSPSS
jgi:succinyl-CoA synthetase alpha subunit/GNAT superfamily N-acetyltransferase